MYFVPGARTVCPAFAPDTNEQTVAVNGSPTLMIALAAPVTIFTEPVAVIRVVPVGQLPGFFTKAKFAATVVVPFPPFHVIFEPTLPFCEPGGGVFKVRVVPPALNAAGVHLESTDVTFPPLSLDDPSVLHATLCFNAADAGIASGIATNPPAATATATTAARPRTEILMCFPSQNTVDIAARVYAPLAEAIAASPIM
jgi:hypothetical protein